MNSLMSLWIVKWMEINTKHAQFIFPEEISIEAQKAANLIEHLYSIETKTLETKPKKVSIILYNQSTTSNGFAALRPRRSVWFSTPSQYASSLGTDDWFYTLGTHEFRHIVLLFSLRKYSMKIFKGTTRDDLDDRYADSKIGKTAIVTKAITPNMPGEIKVMGSFWRAISDINIEEGQSVLIRSQESEDGLTFKVKLL